MLTFASKINLTFKNAKFPKKTASMVPAVLTGISSIEGNNVALKEYRVVRHGHADDNCFSPLLAIIFYSIAGFIQVRYVNCHSSHASLYNKCAQGVSDAKSCNTSNRINNFNTNRV